MKRFARMLAGALATTSLAAAAATLDDTRPMLCAVTTTAVCERDGECMRGSAEAVNLPVLWRVDVAGRTVRSLSQGGEGRSSKVLNATVGDGAVVVQGTDRDLGWSLTVDRESGAMVLAGGRARGFVAFGTCATP